MKFSNLDKVIVIGGGLAGLVTSIKLKRAGIPCLVVEKKSYPFHRVCGEYISNECLHFLKSEQLFPFEFNPPHIDQFQLTSTIGKSVTLPLDLGGFGISRYAFDNFLFKKAKEEGVEFLLNTEVNRVDRHNGVFKISTASTILESKLAVGCFGKRSKLDIALQRKFTSKRSPYVGVKYHIKTDHPTNLIALHNFEGGYCGISNVEDGRSNLCYLVHRDVLRTHRSIEAMEATVLTKNPYLKAIFEESEFLLQAPETINEISFETKEPVWNNMLMVGDAAGMIAPLCGNGMAMAIHSAKVVSGLIIEHSRRGEFSLQGLQSAYYHHWKRLFAKRLWFGRIVQHRLFGSPWSSRIAIQLAINSKFISSQIIRNTHGNPF